MRVDTYIFINDKDFSEGENVAPIQPYLKIQQQASSMAEI